MARAFVALGSNLGDRHSHLLHALAGVQALGTEIEGSPIYESAAVGGPAGQGPFLNAVLSLTTDLSPPDLLEALLEIERSVGRTRDVKWGPRTLDLDILSYGDQRIDTHALTVPHPEVRSRRFVLDPLLDLEPGLRDHNGPFAESIREVDGQPMTRVSGPILPSGERWATGLVDAIDLVASDQGFSCVASEDWSNRSGDTFGGFLAAVALRAAGELLPESRPSQLTYRFLHPVPSGVEIDISYEIDRRTASAVDITLSLSVEGVVAGKCTIATLERAAAVVAHPSVPDVMPKWEAHRVDRLIGEAGTVVGLSARSWTPLERWDVPDLKDGSENVLRAWSPNVVSGCGDPFLVAAAILMPIDALIWPATMDALGHMPHGPTVSTPTIEFTARFVDLTDEAWHIGEARVDHLTDRTVAGTVRIWGESGRYAAIGHSFNLTRPVLA